MIWTPAPPQSKTSRRAELLLALILPAVVWGGCSATTDQGSLRWAGSDGETSFGEAIPLESADTSITVVPIALCRTGTDPVSVIGVTFDQSDGIQVTAFATRIRASGESVTAAEPGTLTQAGFEPGKAAVTTACSEQSDASVSALAIQVKASENRRVKASGVAISYSAGARPGTIRVPMTLVLCVGAPKGQSCIGE